jgi:HK97 family phage portal protein
VDFLRDKAREVRQSRHKESLERKGDIEWDSDIGWNMMSGEAGDAPQSFRDLVSGGYRKNPVVSACIRLISTAFTDAPLHAFIKEGEGEDAEWAIAPEDHVAEQLIRQPNGRDSDIELLERAVLHFFLGGNVYFRIGRLNSGRPAELLPIRPDEITGAATTEDNIPIAYRRNKTNSTSDPGFRERREKQEELVPAADLVHIADADPYDYVFGMPRLLAASLSIRTDNEASDFVSELLNNYGQPGMIVGVDSRTKRRQLRRAEELWEEKFGPGRGRGKVAFVSGATQFRLLGFNLRELEFPDLRRVTREGICAALGVNPLVVSISSASDSSSLGGKERQEARKQLWVQTVVPLMRRFESSLNSFLAPEFGSNVKYKFDLSEVSALAESRDKEIARAKNMAEAGVYTPQEIRRETGFDVVPDGDTIVQDMRAVIVPVEQVIDAEEIRTDDSIEMPSGDEDDDEESSVDVGDFPDVQSGS